MSFIFDALKKAESERHRQSGPVLMDVRIAPTRPRLPLWAWALGAVLLANFIVLAWLLWRRPATSAPPAATTATTAPVASTPVTAPPQLAAPAPVPGVTPAPATPTEAATPGSGQAELTSLQNNSIDSLPTLQELQASGISLPALQLQLHAYDENAASRYVLLNSRRLREGDEVAGGVRIERITPSGVVINAFGRRFRLLAGG